MKKKIISLLVVALMSSVVMAQSPRQNETIRPSDTLIIRKLGFKNVVSESVIIGASDKKVGDSFIAKQPLEWSENMDYIEVRNRRSGEILEISSEDRTRESNTFYSAFIRKKYTWTKGANVPENVRVMKNRLSQTYYMLNDYLIIASSLIVDDSHTYVLESLSDPNVKPFELWYDPNEPYLLYVTKDLLESNNINIEKSPCVFSVKYICGDGEIMHITDNFIIKRYE